MKCENCDSPASLVHVHPPFDLGNFFIGLSAPSNAGCYVISGEPERLKAYCRSCALVMDESDTERTKKLIERGWA